MNEIAVHDEHELAPTSTLFGTNNPGDVVVQAAAVARTLEDVVRRQNLIVRIGQSEHVRVEGWTFLGTMLGVFPVVEWTRPVLEDEKTVGWEARVEARTKAGDVVGAAEAECLRSERTWKGRDDYALRSMAQTRAVSKALRLPLGFVMQLAGFNPTPAEEMPGIIEGNSSVGEPKASRTDPPSVSQADRDGVEPASPTPPIDMGDPDIPFGDAPAPEHQPPKPTQPQLKKLDVLIKATLKDYENLLPRVYATVAQIRGWTSDELINTVGGRDGDGLHWGPLRAALSKHEASVVIDKLEGLEAA